MSSKETKSVQEVSDELELRVTDKKILSRDDFESYKHPTEGKVSLRGEVIFIDYESGFSIPLLMCQTEKDLLYQVRKVREFLGTYKDTYCEIIIKLVVETNNLKIDPYDLIRDLLSPSIYTGRQ